MLTSSTVQQLYTSHNFKLFLQPTKTSTQLQMQVPLGLITTRRLPQTLAVLEQEAPSVLETKCFNTLNLPFCEEVKDTETAHLFEHLLIDFMAYEKIQAGWKEATFRAVTKWDWYKNPVGFFTIAVRTHKQDQEFFNRALLKTIGVMEKIFATSAAVTDTSHIAQVIH